MQNSESDGSMSNNSSPDNSTPRHLYFSPKAADQYGYLTAHFPNGETVNFTQNCTEENAALYNWSDKKLVGVYTQETMEKVSLVESEKWRKRQEDIRRENHPKFFYYSPLRF